MTKPESAPETPSNLRLNLSNVVLLLLLVSIFFVATLVGGLGIAFIGRILALVFGLGLFEASLIALGVALGITYALAQALRPEPRLPGFPLDWDDEDYENEDEWEDEEDAILPPPSRNDPCPCGSGKKYKYCHGR